MAYSARLLRQLGNPSGALGRFILWRLNRVNRGMNQATLQALALSEDDRVLEIGFGGGALLGSMLALRQASLVVGADISQLALASARRKFKREVAAGLVEFVECGEATLPLCDGSFSKVCCVNVIYFWPDVPAMVAEVFRVLSAGGRFVLCYSEGSPDTVTKFPPERVEEMLRDAGYSDVKTTRGRDRENGTYHCTVAVRP